MRNLILQFRVWKDTRGQDLVEEALTAGFLAVPSRQNSRNPLNGLMKQSEITQLRAEKFRQVGEAQIGNARIPVFVPDDSL